MSSPTKIFHAVGLDAGSEWTRCVILELDGELLRFLGSGAAPSQGWSKGRIVDQNAVAEIVNGAIREAEEHAQVSVESVVAGVGASVRGANCPGPLDLGRLRTIEQKDVNRAIDRATRVRMPDDRMILQLFPQDFVVDGHAGHRDPRRMIANQMVANVHLATTSVREHECLVAAINQAHMAVEETVFEGLAACYAAIKLEDRREGFAVLNLGAHTAELLVFYYEAVQLACSLPLSGDHFTKDVARGLRITFEDANIIKQEFGSARADAGSTGCYVEVPSRDDREVPRRALNCILEARAEELFKYVRRELERVGMEGALLGGIFLAGGGARLEGLCDIAERVLGCQARIALPVGIQNWPDEMLDPAWTAAAGLAMYSAKLKSKQEIQRQSVGLFAKILK